jgi:hypothetical protein
MGYHRKIWEWWHATKCLLYFGAHNYWATRTEMPALVSCPCGSVVMSSNIHTYTAHSSWASQIEVQLKPAHPIRLFTSTCALYMSCITSSHTVSQACMCAHAYIQQNFTQKCRDNDCDRDRDRDRDRLPKCKHPLVWTHSKDRRTCTSIAENLAQGILTGMLVRTHTDTVTTARHY